MPDSNLTNTQRSFTRTPIAAGVVLAIASPALLAQQSAGIEEITVTAQKRAENLQDVPISIQALGGEALEELNLMNFMDYTKMLPSVAMEMNGTAGAGSSFSLVYMRGIATAGDGQATTSLPSVGMYLDELPITTVQGNLDVHMYDIARVEALAGPQGTLYGASSQAGTIRIISNKPDLSGFSANVSAQADLVDGDDTGMTVEGYINAPIGDKAAIRLVGWSRSDAGWVDNKQGSRTFYGLNNCAEGDNSCDADDIEQFTDGKDNYNTLDTIGGRAALRVDLNDNWTVTPTVMYQKSEGEGSWGDDLNDFGASGKNAVLHTLPEFTDDEWMMVGLTVEGRIGNFDVVYSGSYLDREVAGSFDYADYSYWYDAIYTNGYYSGLHFSDSGTPQLPNYFVPAYFDEAEVGARVMSGARYTNDDKYTKNNHELRISTDPEKSIRGMLGFFTQKQFHDFEQHWIVEGISPVMWMDQDNPNNPLFEDTVYLNSLYRTDRDDAVFGSVDFDIGDSLVLTLGARFFEPEVHVKGFFGFGSTWSTGTLSDEPPGFNLWSGTGELNCDLQEGDPGWTPAFNGRANWKDKPCLNVDKTLKESESVYRVNLSWDVSDDSMVYFTWSEGYRPGGINRAPNAGEYLSDFLTNYEFGWKTQWMDNRVQFNGAVFHEEWDDFQVSFTGDNAITAVNNGPTAFVDGLEANMIWLPTDNLRFSAAVAFYDTELQNEYCPGCNDDGSAWAPKGTKLPVTADFKGNLVARYTFNVGEFDAHLQGALAHNGSRTGDMEVAASEILGELPAWTTLDLSAGIRRDTWGLDLFVTNATGEDAPLYITAECTLETCGSQLYGIRHRPTTVSMRFTKDFD
jgi:iron complex outermembrane receptor protein